MTLPTAPANSPAESKRNPSASDHLANERTMLAWVRTGIGIIAFGFAVVKFSLFTQQFSLALGTRSFYHPHGYSFVVGILLVAVGAFTIALSYLRYRRTEKQLNEGNYRHSPLLVQLITGLIFMISILLMVYLIQSS